MSKRPPLLGYNHNVRHAGRLFHVQTEDSGLTRLYVTTHLFLDGTILSTARMQYTADEPDEIVQKKMQAQHKTMLKRLRDGDFDRLEENTERLHPPKLEPSGELAIPRELPGDTVQDTLRQAVPAGAREVAKPPVGPVGPGGPGPILAPVAPPPALPRPVAASGSLADRLRRPGGTGGPPPPPIPGARPTPSNVPPMTPPRVSEPQAVLEFEADLPDDDDDLEPAVTIEVVEPPATEQTLSFGPAAPAKLNVPAVPKTGLPASLIQTGVPRGPTPVHPLAAPAAPSVPVVAPPVVAMRTGLATTLRARPTAEGVVLQRTLVPTPSLRPGADSVRTTSPRARPTAPAPLAVAQSIHPLDDDRSLDPVVLAYLAREIRARDA